jgi:hypothetical protein
MPVRKFRSVADMPGAQPRTPLDPDAYAVCLLAAPHEAYSWSSQVQISRGSMAGSQGMGAEPAPRAESPGKRLALELLPIKEAGERPVRRPDEVVAVDSCLLHA